MEDHAGTQRSYGHGPSSYALSGKVMLSAIVVLLFAVLFILGLHVYARCCIIRHRRSQLRREASRRMRRRQSRLVFVGENSAVVEFVPPLGLDASALLSLPIFVFSAKSDEEKAEEGTMECAVCLSEFREGEVGRKLPKCNHSFHVDCIDMWFLSHSTCPLCRAGVHPQPPSEESHCLASTEFASGPDVSSSSPPCDSCRVEQGNIFPDSSSPTSSLSSSSSTSSSSSGSEVPHPSCQQDSSPHRKKGGIRIEVPNRGEAPEGEASSASTSGSRILSLKRILSRDRKFSPRAYPGGSPREVDLERGADADLEELPPRRQP